MRRPILRAVALSIAAIASIAAMPLLAQTDGGLLRGKAAFGDWRADKPGTRRLITPQDLPAPGKSPSAHNFARIVRRTDQKPLVPGGFEVNLFASGLAGPRTIRPAPNGDIFVAESGAGRISVLRPNGGGAAKPSVFASGLNYPFGIAFYPPGPDPQWLYIGRLAGLRGWQRHDLAHFLYRKVGAIPVKAARAFAARCEGSTRAAATRRPVIIDPRSNVLRS